MTKNIEVYARNCAVYGADFDEQHEAKRMAEALVTAIEALSEIEAVDRLVEEDRKAGRLGEEADAAEGDQREEEQREATDHKGADEGWTDLGLHAGGSWAIERRKDSLNRLRPGLSG